MKVIRGQVRDSAPARSSANLAAAKQQEAEPDFRLLFSDVKPLRATARHHPAPPRPSPHPKHRHATSPMSELTEDEVWRHMIGLFEPIEQQAQFTRPGIPAQTLRKLRTGNWPVGAQLDLHGMDRHQAQEALALFLHRARHRGPCLRIIYGKGFGSNGQPILKKLVRSWLSHHPEVLAYCQADETMGGDGALLVLIRRHQSQPADMRDGG